MCSALLHGIVLNCMDALNLAGNNVMVASARGHQLLTSSSLGNRGDFLYVWAKCLLQLRDLATPGLLTHTVLSLSIMSQRQRRLGFLSSLQISTCFSKKLAQSKQMLPLVYCAMLTCAWLSNALWLQAL